ncbi:hypothetical protein NLJ89_g10192 [Agrocybe chaxingu]|uniref:Uncharacterized protein n=1 Tax=Agrocybe chaxingu TaxID=84603 RepID=A0A9W8JPB4_9AGAR|nr:hypothetical protein NLJ89_g10192 [Agrocybe chaxingu]
MAASAVHDTASARQYEEALERYGITRKGAGPSVKISNQQDAGFSELHTHRLYLTKITVHSDFDVIETPNVALAALDMVHQAAEGLEALLAGWSTADVSLFRVARAGEVTIQVVEGYEIEVAEVTFEHGAVP